MTTHWTVAKDVPRSLDIVGSATLTMLPSIVPRKIPRPVAVMTCHLRL